MVMATLLSVENVSDLEIYAQQISTAENHTASRNRVVCHITHMKVHGLTFNSCGKGAVGHDYYADHD